VSGHVNGGTTISLAVGGSSAVINGKTETLATATSSSVTGSSASASATSTSINSNAGSLNAPVCLIALVFGVVGALTIAL